MLDTATLSVQELSDIFIKDDLYSNRGILQSILSKYDDEFSKIDKRRYHYKKQHERLALVVAGKEAVMSAEPLTGWNLDYRDGLSSHAEEYVALHAAIMSIDVGIVYAINFFKNNGLIVPGGLLELQEALEVALSFRQPAEIARCENNPASSIAEQQSIEKVYPSPDDFVKHHRAQGVTDPKELAVKVREAFPALSSAKIGKLLPANPGTVIGYDAERDRGRRLLGQKK